MKQDDKDILAMVQVLEFSLHTLDGLTINLADMITSDEAAAVEVAKGVIVRILTESLEALDPKIREAVCGSRRF